MLNLFNTKNLLITSLTLTFVYIFTDSITTLYNSVLDTSNADLSTSSTDSDRTITVLDSATITNTPDVVYRFLEQYCEISRNSKGSKISPNVQVNLLKVRILLLYI
jgi:hypothetical protein